MSLFAWRWTQRKIPTDDILKSRGVSLASKCQCCEQEESLDHLFFSSSVATQVWTHFGSIFGVAQPKQASNWKININWRARGHLRECIPFLILWFLWIGRNDSKHRLICLRPAVIIRRIRYYIFTAASSGLLKAEHWQGVHALAQNFLVQVRGIRRTTVSTIYWIKPPDTWFKLNTDGSRSNQGMTSTGGLVRDSQGQVLVAFHGFLDAGSILKAELTAILQGLLICLHQQLFPIWVETDSAVAMQIIISVQCSWDLRHILTSIQGIRANHATRITHIHREGNAPADFLASLGMEKRAYAEYFGSTFDKRLVGLCKLDRIGCPTFV
ncbi:hypothetical protein F511_04452 [Dorcoceras hygrometricum]|uniref:RNase H type-1 domain-containing protein n=1 Tax=Dorcoceras hygrometricum TaxID=472368 RepID=A0A2Z7CEH5_9LAMI|nr:hypothetical protein F511_04452 [Dorcoceras hygrometricum]